MTDDIAVRFHGEFYKCTDPSSAEYGTYMQHEVGSAEIFGTIRNVGEFPNLPPTVRTTLRDEDGTISDVLYATMPPAQVRPGDTTPFILNIPRIHRDAIDALILQIIP